MPALKLGVLGVGSLGYHHARILRGMEDVELIGIHDTDPVRLASVADALEVDPFDSAPPLLDRLDAAVIAVPTSAHHMVGIAALERGVDVLIEKPMAPTLDEADRILEAARTAGRLVQIGHIERFNGAVRAAEPYLDEPLFVESHRLAPFGPRGTDVAVVLDLMIHDVDLVLSLIRTPVTAISAVGVPVLSDSPDIANARLEFEGGGVANLTASRVSLERTRKFRFFQPSGYVSLDLATGVGEYLRLRPGIDIAGGGPVVGTRIEDIVERVPLHGDGTEPLASELRSFVDAVLRRREVAVSGEQGRRALAVALEIMKKIDQHVAIANAS